MRWQVIARGAWRLRQLAAVGSIADMERETIERLEKSVASASANRRAGLLVVASTAAFIFVRLIDKDWPLNEVATAFVLLLLAVAGFFGFQHAMQEEMVYSALLGGGQG